VEPPPKKKTRGRPFPKGVSGNPGGRPKTPTEIREALRDPVRIAKWLKNMDDGLDANDAAANALFGKHAIPAEKEVAVSDRTERSAPLLTPEQMLELYRKLK
jgi:hypothetical protein